MCFVHGKFCVKYVLLCDHSALLCRVSYCMLRPKHSPHLYPEYWRHQRHDTNRHIHWQNVQGKRIVEDFEDGEPMVVFRTYREPRAMNFWRAWRLTLARCGRSSNVQAWCHHAQMSAWQGSAVPCRLLHTGHQCCRQAASQVGHTANDGGAMTSAIHCWPSSIHRTRPHGLELLAGRPLRTAGLKSFI